MFHGVTFKSINCDFFVHQLELPMYDNGVSYLLQNLLLVKAASEPENALRFHICKEPIRTRLFA